MDDGIGAIEKLAPENMGVGAGILFLSSTELEKPWVVKTGVKNRLVYEG